MKKLIKLINTQDQQSNLRHNGLDSEVVMAGVDSLLVPKVLNKLVPVVSFINSTKESGGFEGTLPEGFPCLTSFFHGFARYGFHTFNQ